MRLLECSCFDHDLLAVRCDIDLQLVKFSGEVRGIVKDGVHGRTCQELCHLRGGPTVGRVRSNKAEYSIGEFCRCSLTISCFWKVLRVSQGLPIA